MLLWVGIAVGLLLVLAAVVDLSRRRPRQLGRTDRHAEAARIDPEAYRQGGQPYFGP